MHRALEFRLFASCPVMGDSFRVLFKNGHQNFCGIIKKYEFDQVLINHPSQEHDQYIKLKLLMTTLQQCAFERETANLYIANLHKLCLKMVFSEGNLTSVCFMPASFHISNSFFDISSCRLP